MGGVFGGGGARNSRIVLRSSIEMSRPSNNSLARTDFHARKKQLANYYEAPPS